MDIDRCPNVRAFNVFNRREQGPVVIGTKVAFLVRTLVRLGRAKGQAICFNEHMADDGPNVFKHICRMGLEGIVSKRTDAPYRSEPSRTWLKSKNPASEAVRREREEEWR